MGSALSRKTAESLDEDNEGLPVTDTPAGAAHMKFRCIELSVNLVFGLSDLPRLNYCPHLSFYILIYTS